MGDELKGSYGRFFWKEGKELFRVAPGVEGFGIQVHLPIPGYLRANPRKYETLTSAEGCRTVSRPSWHLPVRWSVDHLSGNFAGQATDKRLGHIPSGNKGGI